MNTLLTSERAFLTFCTVEELWVVWLEITTGQWPDTLGTPDDLKSSVIHQGVVVDYIEKMMGRKIISRCVTAQSSWEGDWKDVLIRITTKVETAKSRDEVIV